MAVKSTVQRRRKGYLLQLIHDSSLNFNLNLTDHVAQDGSEFPSILKKNEWLGGNIYTAEIRDSSLRLTSVFCAVNNSTIIVNIYMSHR